MGIDQVVLIVINALVLGGTYALAAIGLSLVAGILRIFNFAHGEFIMVGAYAVLFIFVRQGLPFWVAIMGAMIIVAALALAVERGFFRLTRQNPYNGFIISIGLVYILQIGALYFFGSVPLQVPNAIPGSILIGSVPIGLNRLLILPLIACVMVGLYFLLVRSSFGRAVQASIYDSEAASLYGISIDRMCALVMIVAGALAGLSGVVLTQLVSLTPYLGAQFIFKAFIICIIGGVGSIGGTLVIALAFGFLDSIIAALSNARISILIGVGFMLLVLIIRPKGIFGRE